jgi:hypothetical protein
MILELADDVKRRKEIDPRDRSASICGTDFSDSQMGRNEGTPHEDCATAASHTRHLLGVSVWPPLLGR